MVEGGARNDAGERAPLVALMGRERVARRLLAAANI
jgi:hypothetical protein